MEKITETICERVVVIDTGIDLNNKYFGLKKISGVLIKKSPTANKLYTITDVNDEPNCIQDDIGHGTAVSQIILSHNPNADLFVIKIFDWNSLSADQDLLYCALKYVLDNVDCTIINLSLGFCLLENDTLYKICQQLYENKKYLVSAFDNNGSISYPAAFDTVIGVSSDSRCVNNNDFFVTNNSIVNVCAKGRSQRLTWLNNKLLMGEGNSYACAHITGILSSHIVAKKPFDVLKELCNGIIDVGDEVKRTDRVNPVTNYKKAVIFPFNKEMHSLVRFYDLLPFDLVDIYDIKHSARVGAHTNDLLR